MGSSKDTPPSPSSPIPNPSPQSCPSKSYAAATKCTGSASSPPSSLTTDMAAKLMAAYPQPLVLPSPLVEEACRPWSAALIGKFLGQAPSIDDLSHALAAQWEIQDEFDVFPMSHGFLCFRFRSQADRDHVLLGGPWVVAGAALALSPWSLQFRPSADSPTRAVLWVRLPDLPPAFWHRPILELIVARAGRLLRLDTPTELLSKGRFAKVAVEVDLSSPLVPGTIVAASHGEFESFWQSFEYENLHMLCFSCGRVGHRSAACPFTTSSTAATVSSQSSSVRPPVTPIPAVSTSASLPTKQSPVSPSVSQPTAAADNPWMLVRPRRRRQIHAASPQPPPSKTNDTPPRAIPSTAVAASNRVNKPCVINPVSKSQGPISAPSENARRDSATDNNPPATKSAQAVVPPRSWPFGTGLSLGDDDLSHLPKKDQEILKSMFAADADMDDDVADTDGSDDDFIDASDIDERLALGKLFPKGKGNSRVRVLGPVVDLKKGKKLKKGNFCKNA